MCIGLVAGLLGGLAACRPAATPADAANGKTSMPELILDTPQDAARTVLRMLSAEHAARSQRDKVAASEVRELLDVAIDKNIIREALKKNNALRALGSTGGGVREYVDMWGATLSYYFHGIKYEQLVSLPGSGDSARVPMLIPAEAAGDTAWIRVEAAVGDDKLWRVYRIVFEPPRVAAAITSKPAASANNRPEAGASAAASKPAASQP
jgi:hypothetical protein